MARDGGLGPREAPLAAAGGLLEREREVASLNALLERAAEGDAAVAVIEGPAGIGKTRLVEVSRSHAAQLGFRVLSAHGRELERAFPFGVVRQLFEAPVRADRAGALRGAADPARPIVGSEGEGETEERGGDPSFAALHGLYWLTVHLSEDRPLLLAVDDLQWCDTASLRFLAYLSPRLEALPVALVCSLRTADRGPSTPLVRAIGSDSSAVSIRPRALSKDAAAVLVRERLGGAGDPAFAEACHRATSGNPLLLSELLKALAAEDVKPDAGHLAIVEDLGPQAVSRVVLLRLSYLAADAATVASALAVLGDGADLSTVAALAGLEQERAARAVTALARAEILRAEPPLGFVHPLVAAVVYRDVPSGERQVRHRRAAELLAERGASVEQIAGHLLLAPARGEAWVVRVLRRAAQGALRTGAADSAAAYLGRALTEPPSPQERPELLLELGRAEGLTSGPAATEHLGLAYETLADPQARAVAAQLLGRALLFTGSPQAGAEVARRAAAELPSHLDDLRQALEAFEHFCVLFGSGDREAWRRLEHYRVPPSHAGVGPKMLAAIAAQAWMYACGPSDAVSELSLAALEGGELIAADNGLLANCPITNLSFADREEAETWWEVARADAHRRGSMFAMSAVSLWSGHTRYRRGELLEAERSLRTCLTQLDLWGYAKGQAQIYCDAHLGAVLRERGDLVEARRALERSSDPGGTDDGARYWVNSHIELLLAERRFPQALAASDDYARRFETIIRNPMDAPWRSHKARALDGLGHGDKALELVAAELELARAWGAPGTLSRTLRVLGSLEGKDGLDRLEEAVAVVATSPAQLEHAKALAALGSALRRRGRPAEAREPLRSALDLAVRSGADGLAEQLRSELYAAGARPRTTALAGLGSLTPSEHRVAALVAEGRSNRDVAEVLFVTPKTIEMHLGNIYRKLGVSSRRSLPSLLADEQPLLAQLRP